jgi:hypothetical protein
MRLYLLRRRAISGFGRRFPEKAGFLARKPSKV